MKMGYDKNTIMSDYSRLFSEAGANRLRQLGHDVVEVRAQGASLFGDDGIEYIDCVCNDGIFNLGRRPVEILEELGKSIYETDQGNFPMISSEKAVLAMRLAEFVPGNLNCTVYSVVRGEAMDFACKLARGYTGRKEIVYFSGSYHGETGFSLSISDRPDRELYGPLIPHTAMTVYNSIEESVAAVNKKTAAVVMEPLQAENMCITALYEFISELRRICTKHGAQMIIDETQSGMGRTGRKFFYEYYGIEPDILVIGESLGAGVFPIAATVFTRKLNRFMNRHPLIHLSTFGGMDVGCRVAIKALQIYERDKPWVNAMFQGKKLLESLNYLSKLYPGTVRDVSGAGLIVAMDMLTPEKAQEMCRELSKRGVLASTGKIARHSVVLRPSLTINDREVSIIIEACDGAAKSI